MGKDKFYQELGTSIMIDDLSDVRIEVTAPEPTHDSSDAKVKVVEPDDDYEPGSAKLEETKASPELVAEADIKQAKVTDLEGRLVKVEQERDDSIAKVKTLEDSHKQEAETAKAEAKAGKAELNARIKALEEWKAAKLAEEEATRTAKQQVAEDTTSKEEEKKEKKPSPLFLDFFGTFSPKE